MGATRLFLPRLIEFSGVALRHVWPWLTEFSGVAVRRDIWPWLIEFSGVAQRHRSYPLFKTVLYSVSWVRKLVNKGNYGVSTS